jgi:hypothetical protein
MLAARHDLGPGALSEDVGLQVSLTTVSAFSIQLQGSNHRYLFLHRMIPPPDPVPMMNFVQVNELSLVARESRSSGMEPVAPLQARIGRFHVDAVPDLQLGQHPALIY